MVRAEHHLLPWCPADTPSAVCRALPLFKAAMTVALHTCVFVHLCENIHRIKKPRICDMHLIPFKIRV